MKTSLIMLAAAGSLALALGTPKSAQAGQVAVDIHIGIPGVVVSAPAFVYPPAAVYSPAVAYRPYPPVVYYSPYPYYRPAYGTRYHHGHYAPVYSSHPYRHIAKVEVDRRFAHR
ncbi:MAG: hypothetical protein ACJ8J7_12160 [Sulfurifustaceae bacterium]